MDKQKIHIKGYLNIQAWMRTELNLKGSELLCYALIYGFSQDGKSKYKGSIDYISEWLGIDSRNVFNVIKRLEEKKVIIKSKFKVNGADNNQYQAVLPPDETSPSPLMKHQGTPDETSPNNNNNIPPLPPEGEFPPQSGEKKKPKDIVDDFIETSVEEDFKPIMREWCSYKREKGQSYKPTGLKTCYAKLLKLSNNNPDTARQIIEQSMASNWAGLFAIKDALQKKQHGCMSVGVKINTDEMNYDKSTDWG